MGERIKEYEDVYFKISGFIGSCTTIPQLEACLDDLVEMFRKKKFKRDVPSKKEHERMTYDLIQSVRKKKNSIRFRIHHEKKNSINT